MIRRPPRSTLFPTRRSSDLSVHQEVRGSRCERRMKNGGLLHSSRSEEHTSELQSRGHLVCRLLLEKKKKFKKDSYHPSEKVFPHEQSGRQLTMYCSKSQKLM